MKVERCNANDLTVYQQMDATIRRVTVEEPHCLTITAYGPRASKLVVTLTRSEVSKICSAQMRAALEDEREESARKGNAG